MNRFADLIEYAADFRLATKDEPTPGRNRFSCDAVMNSESGSYKAYSRFLRLAEEMGCRTCSVSQFAEIPAKARQRERYAWLYFVALIAREEGIGVQFNDVIELPSVTNKGSV